MGVESQGEEVLGGGTGSWAIVHLGGRAKAGQHSRGELCAPWFEKVAE